jgi:hypothetical protein
MRTTRTTHHGAAVRQGLEGDVDFLERQARKKDPAALAKIRTGLGMHDAEDDEVASVGRARLFNVAAHSIGYPTWNEAVENDFRPRSQPGHPAGTNDTDRYRPEDFADPDPDLAAAAIAEYLRRTETWLDPEEQEDDGLDARSIRKLLEEPNHGGFDFDRPGGHRYIAWTSRAALEYYLREWAGDTLNETLTYSRNTLVARLPPYDIARNPKLLTFEELIEERGYTLPVQVEVGGTVFLITEKPEML